MDINLLNHDDTFDKLLKYFFNNPNYTPMAQVFVSLIFGLLLSPWSYGLFFLIIFLIVYEFLYYLYSPYHNLFVRTGVIMSCLLGFIIGRTLSQDEIILIGINNN